MHLQAAILINQLKELADPQKAAYKAKKFNIQAEQALGVYQADLNALAKEVPKNKEVALSLYNSGIYEARLLCAKVFPKHSLTTELAEQWVQEFENWEICDTYCLGLFGKSEGAVEWIEQWAEREGEYERRASFATMAGYCMANKTAENRVFEAFFPLIEQAADDERLYVKKAVNWALRNIGKRNKDLHKQAKACAQRLLGRPEKSAQWIGKDALQQWSKPKMRMSDYPRKIYRKKQ